MKSVAKEQVRACIEMREKEIDEICQYIVNWLLVGLWLSLSCSR